MIIETTTLREHAGTSTRSKVKAYDLDSSSGIHRAMYVEGMVEYHSDHRNATLHARTFTRSRVKTYFLDSSSGIHGALYVEGRVKYHSDHRNSYTACRHIHKE